MRRNNPIAFDYSAFFFRYLFYGIAQYCRMVKANFGNYRNEWRIYYVGSVKTAAKTRFKHGDINIIFTKI